MTKLQEFLFWITQIANQSYALPWQSLTGKANPVNVQKMCTAAFAVTETAIDAVPTSAYNLAQEMMGSYIQETGQKAPF